MLARTAPDADGEGEELSETLLVGVDDGVGKAVPDVDGDTDGVPVVEGELLGVIDGLADADWDAVSEADALGVAVVEGELLGLCDGVWDELGVGAVEAVPAGDDEAS